MKDNDFIKYVKQIEIEIEENSERGSIIEILKKDADFLASCDIIDYSILLGEILDDAERLK